MHKIKSGLRTSLTPFADMDTSLKHPFTCIVAGPTGCGKTTFVTRLLRFASSIIDLPPERIVWCYDQWQKTYASTAESMPEVEFVDGLPDPNTEHGQSSNDLVYEKESPLYHIRCVFTTELISEREGKPHHQLGIVQESSRRRQSRSTG